MLVWGIIYFIWKASNKNHDGIFFPVPSFTMDRRNKGVSCVKRKGRDAIRPKKGE